MNAKHFPIAFFSAVAIVSSLAWVSQEPAAACILQKSGGIVTSQNSPNSLNTPFSDIDPKTWGIAGASIAALGGFIAAGVSYQMKKRQATAEDGFEFEAESELALATSSQTDREESEKLSSEREPAVTR
ncbi:hypothetical protein [Geitlerinema sp. PCC 9228]|uniref:hypothetical protein n=1 Tax=Geitlerinema sp. PCC 9228 TaxID=111611 RepID=UPI0008F9A010|nr:hypothetical protein [Geitlerinema sp. PCC 9228]